MLSTEAHWGNQEPIREGSYDRFLYNFYRTYDPTTGRYLSADPTGQMDNSNVFIYARNDPLNLIDPSGLRVPGWAPGGTAGRIVVDKSCEEECPLPLMTKDEDTSGERSLMPSPVPGAEAEVDAVYSPLGTIKIPDNYTCVITCKDGQGKMKCYWRWWWPGSKPECFAPSAPLPGGFPKNPFAK
jgi:RHS repeat-associated protein